MTLLKECDSIFLSRIELDISRHDTRRAIASPQSLHAAIEGCFSDSPGEKSRKLWRLDYLREHMYLLLLSSEKPNFVRFSDQFCALDVQEEIKDYRVLLAQIQPGQSFRFRLRGNPVHSVQTEKGKRGKVLAHVTATHQRGWLIKKAQACGFELTEGEFDVVETRLLRFWRKQKERPVEINTVVFEGKLKVIDAVSFIKALTFGVGRAKAYGCGLLTVMALQ